MEPTQNSWSSPSITYNSKVSIRTPWVLTFKDARYKNVCKTKVRLVSHMIICDLEQLLFYKHSWILHLWMSRPDSRGPYAHLGVVGDRRGWPWVLGWFDTWQYVIWSNFCFTNIAVSYLFLDQDSGGPYAPLGVVSDRRGWPAWPNMVPVIIICHLEQFLFSKLCSKVLYLEIVVKFSSQEHRRPPRIQEEKSGFDSRIPKSGCDLI